MAIRCQAAPWPSTTKRAQRMMVTPKRPAAEDGAPSSHVATAARKRCGACLESHHKSAARCQRRFGNGGRRLCPEVMPSFEHAHAHDMFSAEDRLALPHRLEMPKFGPGGWDDCAARPHWATACYYAESSFECQDRVRSHLLLIARLCVGDASVHGSDVSRWQQHFMPVMSKAA